MHCGIQTGHWCNVCGFTAPFCYHQYQYSHLPSVLVPMLSVFTSLELCHLAYHQEGGDFHFVGAMSSCLSPRRGRFSEGFLLGFRERFLFVEYSPVGLKPVFHETLSHGSEAQEGGRFSLPNLLDFVVSCATSTLGCAPAPRKASA